MFSRATNGLRWQRVLLLHLTSNTLALHSMQYQPLSNIKIPYRSPQRNRSTAQLPELPSTHRHPRQAMVWLPDITKIWNLEHICDSESPNFFTKCTFSIYIYSLYICHFYFLFSVIFHVTAFTRNNKQGKFKWQQSSLNKIFIKKKVVFEFSRFFLKYDKNQQSILIKTSCNCHFHKYLVNKINIIQQNSRH